MPNTNCLAGIRCSQCGQAETFRIAVTAFAIVNDDGVIDYDSDNDWDNDTAIECVECEHSGIVSEFLEGA